MPTLVWADKLVRKKTQTWCKVKSAGVQSCAHTSRGFNIQVAHKRTHARDAYVCAPASDELRLRGVCAGDCCAWGGDSLSPVTKLECCDTAFGLFVSVAATADAWWLGGATAAPPSPPEACTGVCATGGCCVSGAVSCFMAPVSARRWPSVAGCSARTCSAEACASLGSSSPCTHTD